jgi:hypothetical protein
MSEFCTFGETNNWKLSRFDTEHLAEFYRRFHVESIVSLGYNTMLCKLLAYGHDVEAHSYRAL